MFLVTTTQSEAKLSISADWLRQLTENAVFRCILPLNSCYSDFWVNFNYTFIEKSNEISV
jgi:hypothetical protein